MSYFIALGNACIKLKYIYNTFWVPFHTDWGKSLLLVIWNYAICTLLTKKREAIKLKLNAYCYLSPKSTFSNLIPGGLVVKNLPANARRWDSIPGWRRSPQGGSSNPLQYSWLENSMERGDWVIVHKITKSCKELDRTDRLSTLTTLFLLLGYNWSINVV